MQPTFIETYPNALSSALCDKAVTVTDNICARENKGTHYFLSDDGTRRDENIFTFGYGSMETVNIGIETALEKCWAKYNVKYDVTGKLFKDVFVPVIKIQKSSPGGGFFTWHTEQGSSKDSRSRFAVWMIYLNTVTEGGTTDFKFFNMSVQPVKGTCVIWPAAFTHHHRSSPDLKQYKYIATGWFSYQEPPS